MVQNLMNKGLAPSAPHHLNTLSLCSSALLAISAGRNVELLDKI